MVWIVGFVKKVVSYQKNHRVRSYSQIEGRVACPRSGYPFTTYSLLEAV